MKKEQSQNDEQKGKKIVRILIALTIVVIDLCLTIGFIVYFGNRNNKQTTSSSSKSSLVPDTSLTDNFKQLVVSELVLNGFDTDVVRDIVSITYMDDAHTFDLYITASSDTHVYYYSLENVSYSGYDNFVSYLKASNNDNIVGDTSVEVNDIVDITASTDKHAYYKISKDITNQRYISGYYLINNEYRVYKKHPYIDDVDPFDKAADQIIKEGDALYTYYLGLN